MLRMSLKSTVPLRSTSAGQSKRPSQSREQLDFFDAGQATAVGGRRNDAIPEGLKAAAQWTDHRIGLAGLQHQLGVGVVVVVQNHLHGQHEIFIGSLGVRGRNGREPQFVRQCDTAAS